MVPALWKKTPVVEECYKSVQTLLSEVRERARRGWKHAGADGSAWLSEFEGEQFHPNFHGAVKY